MNFEYEGQRNCFTMENDEQGYVKEWVDEETTDQVIKLGPQPVMPRILFVALNATHYQWCGPLLLIVKSLAKITKSK